MSHDVDLVAPFTLAYHYKRSTGPVLGRFLTGLRDGRIEGVVADDGAVLVPATSYDPRTAHAVTDDWVELAGAGTIVGWTWVTEARATQPLPVPFAYALIQLDGAALPMLHVVRAGSEAELSTGARVRPVWAAERVGAITDIACFELEGAS